jgi:hypothetical protein
MANRDGILGSSVSLLGSRQTRGAVIMTVDRMILLIPSPSRVRDRQSGSSSRRGIPEVVPLGTYPLAGHCAEEWWYLISWICSSTL